MPDITIKDVREKYPQYKDMSDDQLASALHDKYYSDMPLPTFREKIGLQEPGEHTPASHFDTSPAGKVTGAIGGVLDVGRSMATGMGADVAGGLMGAATVASNALGRPYQDPVKVIREWQAKAYQPETETGKKIAGGIAKVGAATVGKLKTYLGEKTFKETGSPMEATIAEIMPDVLMTITGMEAPTAAKQMAMRGAEEIARDAMLNQTKTGALREGRQAGFKFTPNAYEAPGLRGSIGRGVTSASNKAEIEREISLHNQKRGVELFKINQELPEDAAVDKATFAQLRAKWGQKYEEARKLGQMQIDSEYLQDVFNAGKDHENLTTYFKEPELIELEKRIQADRGTYLQPMWDANSAVNAMNFLRESSSDLMRSENAIDRKMGQVRRGVAQAIEDRLWRRASKEMNQPELAMQFQEARKKLAQLHVWEDAANFDTGYFSGRGLVAARKAMKQRVDPFTDELKTYTDAAGAFTQSFQDMSVKGGPMPVSVFERYMIVGSIAAATAGGAEVGRLMGHGGTGAAMGASIAASGIAGRALTKSDLGQSLFLPEQTGEAGMLRQGLMDLGPGAEAAGAIMGAESGNQ